MKHALYLGAMALLLLACEQKSDAPVGAANTRGASTTAAAPASTPAAVAAADDIPTEEDFEEEAAKEITADNLEAEVEKIEKEIGQ